MIKTIIFDIGNVLTGFNWKEYYASFGYDEQTQQELARVTVQSPDWNEYDRGILSEEEIFERFVKNAPHLKEELTAILANCEGILKRCDYAIPWIEELKSKGYQVLYLSNFSEKALKDCAGVLDFVPHTDGGIFSCKVHLIKPDPAIYQLLLSTYDLKADECVFLDDLPANIEAAKAQGMHGIVFTSQAEAIEELKKLGVE